MVLREIKRINEIMIAKIPLRISLFGGGTDYPEYFERKKSKILGGTIDQYIYIHLNELANIADQNYRLTYRSVESCNSIEEIQHPSVREVLKYFKVRSRLNIATLSDLPGGTGLGSSSAFTVGLVKLISEYNSVGISNLDLAKTAYQIERDCIGENVGIQDQTHAAFGGFCKYEFGYNHFERFPIPLTRDSMQLVNTSLILVYTGGIRSASQVLQTQTQRTSQRLNDKYLSQMLDQAEVGYQLFQVERNEELLLSLGELLKSAWSLKKSLGPNVSNNIVDEIYQKGIDLGGYGGKLLGAGGQGFVMFLANNNTKSKMLDVFGTQRCVLPKFVNSGATVYHL